MDIYLDTMLWNRLYDHLIDPSTLIEKLAGGGKRLILGDHNVYEIAKNLHRPTGSGVERGKQLFAYVERFMSFGTPYLKDIDELLPAEMWSLQNRTPIVETCYSATEHEVAKSALLTFSGGKLTSDADSLVEERKSVAKSSRSEAIVWMAENPIARDSLRNTPEESLPAWLNATVAGRTGFSILMSHIGKRFPEVPTIELREYADALLRSPNGRVARALVRADLYYNWRCAHRGSNPRDLLDDMYHVISATHCDLYATQEEKQIEYAKHILGEGTEVAIYDGESPIDSWLEALPRNRNGS